MHGNHLTLASFTLILGAGTLIVTGSIWVLSSQVRKLVDLLEEQAKAGEGARPRKLGPTPGVPREKSDGRRSTGQLSEPRAWSRSLQRSSTASRPTDRRIRPGVIPWRAHCSGVCERWLVVVGWLRVVETSPRLGA